MGRVYDLILTGTRWEFGPGLKGLREVRGAAEWRIDTFEPVPVISVEAAVQYLSRLLIIRLLQQAPICCG